MGTKQEVTGKAANETQTESSGHFPILMIMSTAYIAVGINAQGFKAMLPLVQEDFQIGSAEAGFYTTFFFLSAMLIAIFSGRLVDKLGSKKGLVFGVTLIGCLMIVHSIAPIFPLLLLLAFFTGVGFSIITPSINKGVVDLVSDDKRAVSLGITQAGGGIGGILGATLLPFLGEIYGWRSAILVSAFVALLMSIILIKFYRPNTDNGAINQETDMLNDSMSDTDNQATDNSDDNDLEASNQSSFKEDLKILATNKILLVVCLMGFTFGFTTGNITTHYTLFLAGDLGLTAGLAGFSLAIFQTGGILGKPGWGYINDRFLKSNRRLGLFSLGLLVSFLVAFLALVFDQPGIPIPIILAFTFVLGLTSLGLPGLFFTTVGDVVDKELMGTATGLALIFIRTGVVIGPPLLGLLADLTGSYQVSWLTLSAVILLLSSSFFILSRSFKEKISGRAVN